MQDAQTAVSLRRMVYEHLETGEFRHGLSLFNKIICVLILLSVLTAILETEQSLVGGHGRLFLAAEWLFTLIFGAEYMVRVWISVENPKYGPGWAGRLRFIKSPAAVLDLLALLPVFLTFAGSEPFLLRAVRLFRILRVTRLGRFSQAMHFIIEAVASRRYELMLSVCAAMFVLVVSSTLLYFVEGEAQPDNFGSIPRAMWWSIVTLTTVGYGDVFPVTPLGRILAAITAVMGIGLIAMPAGILAAAFSDALQRRKKEAEAEESVRPFVD